MAVSLTIERDGGTWYVLDAQRLVRVADTDTTRRAKADQIKAALETGELPAAWKYQRPGVGMSSFGRIWQDSVAIATVWLPELTALAE